ncbi:chromate transporter [Brevibacillus sp. H7]|uniref:chromate transporter n=1 Tax=Brevibacillus sp. H7 TaxID=3349138 RepID=UPI00381A18AE
MSNPYKELTIAMLRTGILGYGGGPSVIPLIQYEAVSRYRWMDDDEFGEVLAIANALPGPIATKIAAYLGYRLKGITGAILAVFLHILPTSIAMVMLLKIVSVLRDLSVVSGMISFVMPVISVMLGMMAYDFAEKAIKGLGKLIGGGCFLLSFFLLQVISVHPAVVILIFLAYGTVHFKLDHWFKRKGTTNEKVSA